MRILMTQTEAIDWSNCEGEIWNPSFVRVKGLNYKEGYWDNTGGSPKIQVWEENEYGSWVGQIKKNSG